MAAGEYEEQFGALVWDSVDATSGIWMPYDESTHSPLQGAHPTRIALEGDASAIHMILKPTPFVKWVGQFRMKRDEHDQLKLACEWPHSATAHVPYVRPEAFVHEWTVDGIFNVTKAAHAMALRLAAHHELFQQWLAWRSLRSYSRREFDATHLYELPEDIADMIPYIIPEADIEREWNSAHHVPPGNIPPYVDPQSDDYTCALLLSCVLGATSIYRGGLIPRYKPSKEPPSGAAITHRDAAASRLGTPIQHFASLFVKTFALPRGLGSAYLVHTILSKTKAMVTWESMTTTMQAMVCASPSDPEPVDWSLVFQSQINTTDVHAYVHQRESDIDLLKKPIRIYSQGQFFAITKHIAAQRKHYPWFSVRGALKRYVGLPDIAPKALQWIGSMSETLFRLWTAMTTCWPVDVPWNISLHETPPGKLGHDAARASCVRPDTIVVVPWAFFHDADVSTEIKSHANVKEVTCAQSLLKLIKKMPLSPIVWLWADWATPMEWFYVTLALLGMDRPDLQALSNRAQSVMGNVTIHLSTRPPIFVDGPRQAYFLHRLAAVPVQNMIRIERPVMTTADALLNGNDDYGNAPILKDTLKETYWDLKHIHGGWTSGPHPSLIAKQLSQASIYVRGLGSRYRWDVLPVSLESEIKVGDPTCMDWHRGGMCGLSHRAIDFQARSAENIHIQSILTMHPMNACDMK